MKASASFLLSCLFLALAPATPAATIWDNGLPDQGAYFSDFNSPQQIGDNFTLGTTATAGQIQWWGVYSSSNTPTAPDDFTIRFFTITAGVPDTTPFASYSVGDVGKVDSTLDDDSGFDIYSFSATIPNTTLGPGDYLLSIVNNTAADANDDWGWSTSSQSGTAWFRSVDGNPWNAFTSEMAFNISGPANGNGNGAAVPDTGTSALLFGFGIAGLFFAQRRLEALNRGLRHPASGPIMCPFVDVAPTLQALEASGLRGSR